MTKNENTHKKWRILISITGCTMAVVLVFAVRWIVDITNYVTTEDARVTAFNVHIASKIQGKVLTIQAKEGDLVSANQILLVLDKNDALIAVGQAKANYEIIKQKLTMILNGTRSEELAMAKAKMVQAKIGVEMARDDFNRLATLHAQQLVSTSDYQKMQRALATNEQMLLTAEQAYKLACVGPRQEDRDIILQQVAHAKLNLEQAQINLENTVIKTSITGTVAQKNVNVGEIVSAGQNLFTVINTKEIWIQANIKETDVQKIRLQAPVAVYLDIFPGRVWPGFVAEIGVATNSNFALLPFGNSAGNFVKVVQNIPVKIKLQESVTHFPVGSSAKVKISLKS